MVAAEPRGFGCRSVAIDLAKRSRSECGITERLREGAAVTNRSEKWDVVRF